MQEAGRYYLVYKPYGMLSQFTPEGDKRGLGDLFAFPKDVYPVGRLDADSEGLLILTNDNYLKTKLLEPGTGHRRTYLVQVEGAINPAAIEKLSAGMQINIDGKPYRTLPAGVSILEEEPAVPPRCPPIRFRKNIPTSWIEMTLAEGKNRQIRRMTAKAGFPALRIIRTSIEGISITGLMPGGILEMKATDIYRLLGSRQEPLQEPVR
jgi:23S rRNA pseudouridine2457 synthase